MLSLGHCLSVLKGLTSSPFPFRDGMISVHYSWSDQVRQPLLVPWRHSDWCVCHGIVPHWATQGVCCSKSGSMSHGWKSTAGSNST